MNLDITFCSKINCEKNCERNQNNIMKLCKNGEIELNHPISMANFKECEFWEVEDE